MWKIWFPDYGVPKKLEDLISAGILKDETWAEDVAPHFEASLTEGGRLVVWVDHPIQRKRFLPDGMRYEVQLVEPGELPIAVIETNRFSEAIMVIENLLSKKPE